MSKTTIYNYLETKNVTFEELDELFVLERKIYAKVDFSKICPNCGDKVNIYRIPSESWTSAARCIHCSRIFITMEIDRMSGNTDPETTYVYKEKEDE